MKNTQTPSSISRVENGMNKGLHALTKLQKLKLVCQCAYLGRQTFKTAAPYRVSDIENENVFRGVAHYAYKPR